MICFSCHREGIDASAAAVCHHCGVGICPGHLFETEIIVTKTVPLGRKVPLPLKARRIYCGKCREAFSQPE
jgi:hypothetical protein